MKRSGAKVTALDVARRAGVSQPTVSRVFSHSASGSVRHSVRVKVEQAANDLGYRPNTLARSLITGRSHTIGVVVAYLENPFYAEALEKLSASLTAEGYHISIFFAANMEEEVDPLVEKLLAQQVDGIILASVSMSNRLTKRLKQTGVPFVLFNRGQKDDDLAAVTAANYEGGRKAGEFLLASGHENIAHVAGWQRSLNGRERQQGLVDALAHHGQKPCAVIDGMFDRETAAQAARDLFKGQAKPDAIFVGNDHMAFAVLEVLKQELVLDVPGDVAVLGYDDVKMAAWTSYNLSTLRQPANRMVQATTKMLIEMIDNPDIQPGKIRIESDLILRGTTR
ncbi:MAG: LacI family DNA-binding transcriptional regulator [Pseudomonadota bacterium]